MELFHIINRFIHKNRRKPHKKTAFDTDLSTFVDFCHDTKISNTLIRRFIFPRLFIMACAIHREENDMEHFYHLLIGRRSQKIQAAGYMDTGNTLTDISTGKPVIVAPPELMYELLPQTLHGLLADYINGSSLYDRSSAIFLPEGMHLVPYRTISTSHDLMLAFDCDFFFINDRLIKRCPLIGISRSDFKVSRRQRCVLLNSIYMRKVRSYAKYSCKSRF